MQPPLQGVDAELVFRKKATARFDQIKQSSTKITIIYGCHSARSGHARCKLLQTLKLHVGTMVGDTEAWREAGTETSLKA